MRKEYSGSNELLQKEINHNFESIDDSIKSLYSWYEDNKNIIKEDQFLY
jgi:hypothetical protein